MDVRCPECDSVDCEEMGVYEDFPDETEVWYLTDYVCTDCGERFTIKEIFERTKIEVI